MGPCSQTWTFLANEIGATGLRRSSVLLNVFDDDDDDDDDDG